MCTVSRPACGLLLVLLLLYVLPSARADTAVSPLGLAEAGQIALQGDPLTRRHAALAASYAEQAVADAQLPDPSLNLGAQNLPTDTFNTTQEDMTMVNLGMQQRFPPGDTLRHRAEQSTAYAASENARAEEQRRRVLNAVRNSWLESYYQARALETLRASYTLLEQLLRASQTQYGAGLVSAQDMLNAELELRQLKERIIASETAYATAQADLARWTGPTPARPLAADFPLLQSPLPYDALQAALDQHPRMQLEEATVRASNSEVDLARDNYKPSWEVGVGYGSRGGGRSDFASAGVSVSIPLFADKRQDRRLAASEQQAAAARYTREDVHRTLLHELDSGYSQWRGLSQRLAVYEKDIVPQAEQNATLAVLAYQSNNADFATVMRARVVELEARLQTLRLRVDHARAQAGLIYLMGESS
jgi:outer membrane protein TolC